MRIHGALIAALVVAQFTTAAHAQLGGLFGRRQPAAEGQPRETGCADKPRKNSIGRQMLGSMLGEVTGRVTGEMGMIGRWVPSAAVAGVLTDAIACKLDPKEQQQAADATLAATRQDKIGATSSWTSSSRPGVTGTSTVVSRTASTSGGSCMTVSDVVIVEGEETTVAKRMCRVPPATGYTIAQA